MTERRVSLLRGINVGGHNLVPMARLRAIYEAIAEIVAGSRMTMNRHGWLFRLLPDQRATSVRASSSASVSGSGVNSRI